MTLPTPAAALDPSSPATASLSSPSPAPPRGPALERFVERYPSLGSRVDSVLEAAARLRAAASLAFGETGLPGPRFDAEHVAARQALVGAVERLVAADTARASEAQVEAKVDEVLDAALRLRVAGHAFSPQRPTTSAAARSELLAERTRFNEQYRELERAAVASRVRRLPWQLELCSHHDPASPMSQLEVTGYGIPDTPGGRMPWGERCWLSGTPFHTDSRARPLVRYRSLDNVEHVLCEECRPVCAALRVVLDALAPAFPRAVERAAAVLPLLWDEVVEEPGHPAFVRLGLVDFPSLAVALHNMLRACARRPLFGTRGEEGGFASLGLTGPAAAETGYRWETFDEARRAALRVSYALERRGLRPGDRVGLLAEHNCRDFYWVEFASVFSRLVTVGLPSGATTHAVERQLDVLAHTGARVLVCDAGSARSLCADGLLERCPALERVVVFGSGERPSSAAASRAVIEDLRDLAHPDLERQAIVEGWRSASGIHASSPLIFDDEAGAKLARSEGIVPDEPGEVFTILFTSGSTGRPKGSVLTRRRWAEEACARTEIWPHVAVSFQPSAAIADRGAVWRALHNGGRVGFARRGADLFPDVRAIRPTLFDVPPVIWNTIYARYKAALGDVDLDGDRAPEVRRRFRDILGGRVAIMAVGGAPPDPGVSRAMESIFGIPMFEGYAATEVGSIASNGVLVPGLDYKVIDRPELGLTTADRPHPRGELAVRSPRSSDHYFLDEESSRESFTDDGYFLTGDLVELQPGGRVNILGRRKLFFKLAGAEFVSPEPLERAFSKCDLVEHVLVTALPTASQVVAVVVPSRDGVGEEAVLAALQRIARADGLRACETPAAVVVVARAGKEQPWTAANGLLTQSLKLNRRALEERYRDAIAGAYERRAVSPAAELPPATAETSTAVRLRRVIAAVLGVEPAAVDLDATFEQNGGTSLTSMELLLRLEEVFADKRTGRDESYTSERALQDVVSGPLRGLVEWLGGDTEREAPRVPPVEVAAGAEGPAPPPAAPSVLRENDTSPRRSAGVRARTGAGQSDENAAIAALATRDALDLPTLRSGLVGADSPDVLVTGSTGLLGAHLLESLMRSLPAGARVFALARAADHRAAALRIVEAGERFGLRLPAPGALGSERGERLVAVAGRLEAERLGLNEPDWLELARRVGTIHHLGAAVDHFGGYPALRDANVLGTRRVLELATTTTIKALHFVSSINVAMILGQLGARAHLEELALPSEIAAETVRRNAGYAVTKLVSERLVQGTFERLAQSPSGTPRFSISRPSLISWSPVTGCSNPQDWLSRLLSSCLSLRAVPGGEEVAMPFWIAETETSARGLDMVPVDWVASSIARLGTLTWDRALPGPTRPAAEHAPTFHVCNNSPGERGLVSFQRFVDLLALADLRTVAELQTPRPPAMRYLPRQRWLLEVEVQGAPFRPFVRRLKQSPPSMARAVTTRFAAALGSEALCPGFDSELLLPYVRRHHGLAPRAGGALEDPLHRAGKRS